MKNTQKLQDFFECEWSEFRMTKIRINKVQTWKELEKYRPFLSTIVRQLMSNLYKIKIRTYSHFILYCSIPFLYYYRLFACCFVFFFLFFFPFLLIIFGFSLICGFRFPFPRVFPLDVRWILLDELLAVYLVF